MEKLKATCLRCKESYPQTEFARKDIIKKNGKLAAKPGKTLICHDCGNGSNISVERHAKIAQEKLDLEIRNWESNRMIESFEDHCRELAEGYYQPWLRSDSMGRTFKDKGKVSWDDIKDQVSIYRLQISRERGPGYFVKLSRDQNKSF